MDKYWKIIRWCKDVEYNCKYPYLVAVRIRGELGIHHWRLPMIDWEQYDIEQAVESSPAEVWACI